MTTAKYQQLFHYAEQLTPYLKGKIGAADHQHISAAHGDPELLNALYLHWKKAHPEAGMPYWLTRSWTMLAWQPLYIAFISVYALNSVPPMSKMALDYKEGVVAGFHLCGDNWFTGERSALIKYACTELAIILDGLQSQFNQFQRMRPGLTRPLIADAVLEALVQRQALLAEHELSTNDIQEQAQLWFDHLGLPKSHLQALKHNSQTGYWELHRISCCMHYRRHDGTLCDNCPRQ